MDLGFKGSESLIENVADNDSKVIIKNFFPVKKSGFKKNLFKLHILLSKL